MPTLSLQLLSCVVGRHHRDHHRVRHWPIDGHDHYVSTCKGCRAPMIKDRLQWRVMSALERAAITKPD